ncbi:2-oxoacid:ferredoxin oxidoreductase subunit beta [Tindallia californiensis]|uniref:2-oxoglutarate ferredoxin oxidoreductase subunit beta n=1 Tax=Tindallia californiensis TaxID=159292 RepID=A0A1H3JLT7_9FIRM|nr:2-oxoacid:ferredoxin oxidoreductase subunit beta [Tindallia californiensis]SDY40913.1 2-oxoglutarate ferredoxin oxidoreductase subunit beta [Tindallia californiensis]
MELKDYSSGLNPTWCKGCGDFSVLRSLQAAVARLEIARENLAVVSGIGCSGRISGYMNAYSFHSVHGRSLPVAQGIKLSNSKLSVIAAGGDGDGFAIGTSHTIHAIRRNIDMTYIVMNNQVYGLTKGHVSPVSHQGFQTKMTPDGSVDMPIEPGMLALGAGISFYAQGFSAYQEELIEMIMQAIQHPGFSLVQVFSPCVTYNKVNTYQWFRDKLQRAEDLREGSISDRMTAADILTKSKGLCTGIIIQNKNKPSYHTLHNEKEENLFSHQPCISEKEFHQLTKAYMV